MSLVAPQVDLQELGEALARALREEPSDTWLSMPGARFHIAPAERRLAPRRRDAGLAKPAFARMAANLPIGSSRCATARAHLRGVRPRRYRCAA